MANSTHASTLPAAVAAVALAGAFASAQPEITWYTIDGGGGTSSGGGFTLMGTVGQCDAGGPLAAGDLVLVGGFWGGAPGGCPADWDGNGSVNSSDISAFLTTWLMSIGDGGLAGDFSGDGVVNSSDIAAFLTAWLAAIGGEC